MNAPAQLLTITLEQLKQFDREKDSIAFDVQSTNQILSQMGTLFHLIAKAAEEEGPSIRNIKNLATLGQYTCDDWLGVLESIENRIRAVSPLESTKV